MGPVEPHTEVAEVRTVRGAFDAGPFFARVVPLTLAKRLVPHPLDPLAYMRTRRALVRLGHEGADG